MKLSVTWMVIGCALGFLAVALGAFGAHAMRERLGPERLGTYQTGVQYQMYHALALIGTGLFARYTSSGLLDWAGWLFLAGVVLFSGSLYGLSVLRIRAFGPITPLGGLCFLAGWLLLLLTAVGV